MIKQNFHLSSVVLLLLITLFAGVFIGVTMENADASIHKTKRGYIIKDKKNDEIEIVQLNDTTYLITHPKIGI